MKTNYSLQVSVFATTTILTIAAVLIYMANTYGTVASF